jgi:hypothetical protein
MKHKIYVLFWKDRTINEYIIYGVYTTEELAERQLKRADEKGYGGLMITSYDLEGDLKCLKSGSHFAASNVVTSYESTSPTMLLHRSHKKKTKNALNYF